MEDKAKRYMRQDKYNKENYDRITLLVPKGHKQIFNELAKSNGMSLSKFADLLLLDAEQSNYKPKEF